MRRILLLSLVCPAVWAADASLFESFVKRCESVHAWSVETQTKDQEGAGTTRLFFAAPAQLRVEQGGESERLIVLNSAHGWVYLADEKVCHVFEQPDVLRQLQKSDLALGAMAAPELFSQMTMRGDAKPVKESFEGTECTRFELEWGELRLKLWLEAGKDGPRMRGSEMSHQPKDVTQQAWSRRQVYSKWRFEKPAEDRFVFTPPADVKVLDALARREQVRVAPIPLPTEKGKLWRDFEARQTAWLEKVLLGAFSQRHAQAPWFKDAMAALREAAPFLNEGGTRNETTGVTTKPDAALLAKFKGVQSRGCDDALFAFVRVFLESFLKFATVEQVREVEAVWPKLLSSDDAEIVKAFASAWLWSTAYAGSKATKNEDLKQRCDQELEKRVIAALESPKDREDAFGVCQMFRGEWPLSKFRYWRRDKLMEPMDRCRGPRWVIGTLLGDMEVDEAWEKRGDEWASAVTDEGWKGFEHWLAKARAHLVQAWEEEKGAPWAATRMIVVTMAGHGVPGLDERAWFDRATAACFDHMDSYEALLWAWRPRWGGSHELMLEFGKACADTKLYDTIVPSRLFKALRDVSGELACKDTVHDDPELCRKIVEVQKGMVATAADEDEAHYLRSFLVVNAFLTRDYDTAVEAYASLTKTLHTQAWQRFDLYGKYPLLWKGMLNLYGTDKAAFATFEKAEAAYGHFELEEARKLYQEALQTPGVDKAKDGARLIRMRLAAIGVEKRLQKGDWVKLAENERKLLWLSKTNNWWNHEGGHLSLKNEWEGEVGQVILNARVGLDFELKARLENPPGLHHAQIGLLMGFRWNYNGWSSAVAGYTSVNPNTKGAALVSYSYAASEDSPHGEVELQANSTIHLRVKDGIATLTIDGKEVVNGDIRSLYRYRDPWREDSPLQNLIGFGSYYYPKGESWIKDIEIRRIVE